MKLIFVFALALIWYWHGARATMPTVHRAREAFTASAVAAVIQAKEQLCSQLAQEGDEALATYSDADPATRRAMLLPMFEHHGANALAVIIDPGDFEVAPTLRR